MPEAASVEHRPGDPIPAELMEYWLAEIMYEALDELRVAAKRAKSERGISRSELARRIAKDRSLVTKRLDGQHNFTLRTLNEMARGLDHRLEVRLLPLWEVARANYEIDQPSPDPVVARAARRD